MRSTLFLLVMLCWTWAVVRIDSSAMDDTEPVPKDSVVVEADSGKDVPHSIVTIRAGYLSAKRGCENDREMFVILMGFRDGFARDRQGELTYCPYGFLLESIRHTVYGCERPWYPVEQDRQAWTLRESKGMGVLCSQIMLFTLPMPFATIL